MMNGTSLSGATFACAGYRVEKPISAWPAKGAGTLMTSSWNIGPNVLPCLIISPLTYSTEIEGGSCCLRPAMLQQALGIVGIQHLVGLEPGPPGDRHAVAPVVELRRVMGVVVDRQRHPGLAGACRPAVVEIKPKGAAVDLERGSRAGRFPNHRLDVDGRLAAPVESPGGRMGEDIDVRRLERPAGAFGDHVFGLIEGRMDGRDD